MCVNYTTGDIVRNLAQNLPPYCFIASVEVHKPNELSHTALIFSSIICRKQNDSQLICYVEIHSVDASYFVHIQNYPGQKTYINVYYIKIWYYRYFVTLLVPRNIWL